MRSVGRTVPGRPEHSVSANRNAPNADAFAPDVASLYRKYAAKVGRWAARLGGPSIEVEDVVQEVFLVAKRRLVSFRSDGGGSVTTWLFRATDRIVKATRRKQRLRRMFGGSADLDAAGADLSGPLPGDELESRQEIARVYRVLDRLPERQRRVLILFELEGMSTPDIAALIGARVGTVRVWLYRARAAFLEHHEAIAAVDANLEDRR
jgi:RNA polymerase sigma-70 factor (ECF subfamily)